MGDAVKLNGAEVAPDAWIEGVESAEFKTLIDAKQRSIVPMIVIYMIGYMGLSVLAGFGRGILGIKVLAVILLPYTIEPLNYALGNIFGATYLTFNPAGVPAAYVRLDGFRANERPIHGVYAKSAVFSGNKNPYQQDPTGLHYVIANSPVIATEAGYLWDAPVGPDQPMPGDRKVYPGIYRFGGVVNYNGIFTDPFTGPITKGSYLYYFMASQAVYRADVGSNRGPDLTFAYDNSPNSTNRQNSMITAGGVYHGIVPRRTMDDVSFGFVSTRTGNAYSQLNELLFGYALGWEKAYTLDYRAQVKPWFAVQPTVQVLQHDRGQSAPAEWVRCWLAYGCEVLRHPRMQGVLRMLINERGRETTSKGVPHRRWLIAFLLAFGVLVNYFDRVNLSVAKQGLEKDFGITNVTFGYLLSAYNWTYAALQLPDGRAARPFRRAGDRPDQRDPLEPGVFRRRLFAWG